MTDRLVELFEQHEVLYGIICRDPTLVDIELFAQVGYHVIWMDLEHSSMAPSEAMRLCRTIEHLEMVPLVRVIELARRDVQSLVDAGFRIILLPDITNADQAAELVRLSKFPPLGRRGVSSSGAGTGYTLGEDTQQTLARANETTHLMVQFESDTGLANLDAILGVDGIDMVTVGPNDWAISLGAFDEASKSGVSRRIEKVFTAARAAGRITAMGVSSAAEAERFIEMGVRLFFVGVDINVKRKAFATALTAIRGR